MKLARALSILCLFLAGASALATGWATLEDKMPLDAASSGIGDSHAKARLASDLLEKGFNEGAEPRLSLSAVDDERIARLAGAAYRTEPLIAPAIRNLALLADARGDVERARALIAKTQELTRRDLATNTWLISDSASRGDVETMLNAMDHALRTSSRARTLLIPRLVAALSRDEVRMPMLHLLRRDPDWEEDFWEKAHSAPEALGNITELRIAREVDGKSPPHGYDARLFEALMRNGNFAQAERLDQALMPAKESAEIVRNGAFGQVDPGTLMGWNLLHDADLSVRIDSGAGKLIITAYGSAEKVAARQLIRLPEVPLVLRGKQSAAALIVRLRCAESSGVASLNVDLIDSLEHRFVRPSGDCEYYWLEVVVPSAEKRGRREASLVTLSLTAAAHGSTGAPNQ